MEAELDIPLTKYEVQVCCMKIFIYDWNAFFKMSLTQWRRNAIQNKVKS